MLSVALILSNSVGISISMPSPFNCIWVDFSMSLLVESVTKILLFNFLVYFWVVGDDNQTWKVHPSE